MSELRDREGKWVCTWGVCTRVVGERGNSGVWGKICTVRRLGLLVEICTVWDIGLRGGLYSQEEIICGCILHNGLCIMHS